ncbi:MAG TPA: apolipoprotein N-acyltransferase, partial [Rubrivivax sp.]|nr:apolipoprotein N-acyltransferase [Rubrivivax sp.]
LATGQRWRYGVVHADAAELWRALHPQDGAVAGRSTSESTSSAASAAAAYAQACLVVRKERLQRLRRLHHPIIKFAFFPLLLAMPAFRMHQHIAYGSAFGEYYTFGLAAYTTTLALWWAAWAMGVVLCAAVLRAAIEAGTLTAVLVRRQQAVHTRRWLERLGLAALYVGLPAWLLLRIVLS